MGKPLIVLSDPECRFVERDLQRLREVATIETSPRLDIPELVRCTREADVLVVSCFAPVPAEVVEAGSRLLGIVKYGVGVDNIELKAAAARNIPVANCPDYGSGTVADHAFALLIALARKVTMIDRDFRREGWFWPDERYIGLDLEGKTIGIVGLGRIGRKMARRAAGFDMRIVACDPYADRAETIRDGLAVEWLELDELLAVGDFVSLHCVLTPQTRGLIGRRELQLMKPSALLIDVSRGDIIDEAALLDALAAGQIAGAGLDVFSGEPLPADHPLLQRDDVVLAPHLAWYTREAAARQSGQAADAVLDLLAGRRPRSVVNGVG